MPPIVAALICSVFVLTVFVVDFKRKPNVTISHWIPFTWLLIVSSRPVVLWLNPDNATTTEIASMSGSQLDAIVFTILIVFGIVILSRRAKECTQILMNNPWLIVLFLYCGISILWSDYPSISLKRWFRGIGTFIMVLVVLTESDPLETIKTMFRRCAFLMVPLSILFIKYFREWGVYYGEFGGSENVGVTTHKNLLGRLCLVLGFYFFWEIYERWKNKNKIIVTADKNGFFINVIFLIMILWLLHTANSATALGCMIIAIFVLLLLNIPIVRRNINITFIILVFILFIFSLTIDIENIFVTSLNRDMTFTGRTEVWSFCLNFVKNPLIGAGFEGFWLGERLEIIWDKYWWHPIQAHNGYIEVYLELGLFGLFLLSGVIFSIYKKIRKTLFHDFQLGSFQLSFLILFLIYNFTESAFGIYSFLWFVFLLISLNQNIESPSYIRITDG